MGHRELEGKLLRGDAQNLAEMNWSRDHACSLLVKMALARPVTLQDIARRAGVSKMTVSLALRGHPHASIATRDRLRLLARAMGYRPNPLITAAMTQLRTGLRSAYAGTIAFAGFGPPPDLHPADSPTRRVFLGAQRRAEALGYGIAWFPLDDPEVNGRRLTDIIKARGILGVILGANRVVPPRAYLEWSNFALAAIGRTEVGRELHRTMGDYYRAVREICQRCRERGYRRIGLAISHEHNTAHQGLHRSALLGWQAEWPQRGHVPVLVAEQWKVDIFLRWVGRYRPDVVIASEDDPFRWLIAAGYKIPADIGFIRPHVNSRALGIGGFLFEDTDLGAAAVDLVVEQLNHNERGVPNIVKQVLLRGRWFEGHSLRPPKKKTTGKRSLESSQPKKHVPRGNAA